MRPVVFVLLAVVGCSSTPLPEPQPIDVTMRPAVEDDAPAVRVEVTNNGERPIYVTGCSFGIQRRVGDDWELARSGACVYVLNEIAPGASRSRAFSTVSGGLYRPVVSYRTMDNEAWQFAYGAQVAW